MMSDEPEPDSTTTPKRAAKCKAKAKGLGHVTVRWAWKASWPSGGVSRAEVAAAARALGRDTIRASSLPVALTVGPVPPEPSTTGRRYYAFRAREGEEAFIACGQSVALTYLGGSWLTHALGQSPKGFNTLEDAVNYCAVEWQLGRITVRWA